MHPTISNDGHSGRPSGQTRLVDRGDLGHPNSRDDSSRADRPRAHSHLDAIRSRIDQRLGTFARRHIASDDVDGCGPLEEGHHLDHGTRVSMCGVHNQNVNTGINERMRTLLRVWSHAHRGSHHEPTISILGSEGVLVRLHEVLHREESPEASIRMDQRQLLHLVLRKQAQGILGIHSDGGREQRHRRHHVPHPASHVIFETHVSVGDDSDQHLIRVNHGNTAHAIVSA